MKKKVLDRKYLSPVLPVTNTAVVYLLLDKFNAPDLVWGIMGTLYLILWVLTIILASTSESKKPKFEE